MSISLSLSRSHLSLRLCLSLTVPLSLCVSLTVIDRSTSPYLSFTVSLSRSISLQGSYASHPRFTFSHSTQSLTRLSALEALARANRKAAEALKKLQNAYEVVRVHHVGLLPFIKEVAQMNDSQLNIGLACTAALAGAAVLNHAEVISFLKDDVGNE